MKRLTAITASLLGATLASAAGGVRADAQITEVARTPIADAAQITFGYLCGDRFVVRNDGTRAIDLAYGVEKGTEHTKLALNARESVELQSTSKHDVELWMDGKMIARASKEKRSCKDVQGNASVSVNPLEVNTTASDRSYARYGSTYPFYDPWYLGAYGYYGSPFGYRPYYSTVISRPIIINRRGGGHRRR
ncbi:MAG: hypothetical protein ABI910_09570 [Gemmatimonadota bacterium]